MSEPVHFSRLKLMKLSAAHYLAAEDRDEETPAKRMGTLVHARTLGGELIVFEGARTGNAWKAFRGLVGGAEHFVYDGAHNGNAWKAAKEQAAGRLIVSSVDVEQAAAAIAIAAARRAAGKRPAAIVTREEYERANRCADIVRAHPVAGPLLEGEREVPLDWDIFGRACAGHLDVMHPERVVEVKTSTISEPTWFARQALRMDYPSQLFWYREGARWNGHAIDDCYIIAIETRPPFAVSCMKLTDRALEQGEKTVRLWMERLLSCEAAGVWPEYVQSIVDLDVPEDFELDFGEAA
jgi:hypothetical protein